jgi:hypothetical protein
MSRRTKWIAAGLGLLTVVAIALLAGAPFGPPFLASVARYDSITGEATIVISNASESELEVSLGQWGSNDWVVSWGAGTVGSHETNQIMIVVNKDYAPDIYLEGTRVRRRPQLHQLLERLGIDTRSSTVVLVGLTNGSRWAGSTSVPKFLK